MLEVLISHCAKRVTVGDLSDRTLKDYTKTLKKLAELRGVEDQPNEWTPEDYGDIKESLAKPVKRVSAIRGGVKGPSVARRSSVTVDIELRNIKAFLNWCNESELIAAPRYGRSFSQTTAKQKRLIKAEGGARDLTSGEIRSYLEHSTLAYKPIILLGINGGMGAGDIGALRVGDYRGEWLDCARKKTGVGRRIWLWPETREAIDAHLASRPRPKDTQPLFVTRYLNPWIRGEFDAIGKYFSKIRDENGLRGTFYDLRRTFQTVAEGSLDFPAVKFVMGHAPTSGDMSSVYRQKISDERIIAVCEHVRSWLYKSGIH